MIEEPCLVQSRLMIKYILLPLMNVILINKNKTVIADVKIRNVTRILRKQIEKIL